MRWPGERPHPKRLRASPGRCAFRPPPRPLDLAKFEKQIHYALSREDAEWAGRELERLSEMADRYLKASDPTTAGTLYHLILEKAPERFEGWWLEWDSDGDISPALSNCVEGLGLCLEEVEDAVVIARQHFADVPGLVLDFANRLVDSDHGEVAGAYMTDWLWPAGVPRAVRGEMAVCTWFRCREEAKLAAHAT